MAPRLSGLGGTPAPAAAAAGLLGIPGLGAGGLGGLPPASVYGAAGAGAGVGGLGLPGAICARHRSVQGGVVGSTGERNLGDVRVGLGGRGMGWGWKGMTCVVGSHVRSFVDDGADV